MNKYAKAKERARTMAIEWQNDCHNHNYSYEECVRMQNFFESLARKYGLVGEFKENGII